MDKMHCRMKGNTAQFPPDGLSTAPAAAARHLRCQNARQYTKYCLRFWLSTCRTSHAVSALRIMRHCPEFFGITAPLQRHRRTGCIAKMPDNAHAHPVCSWLSVRSLLPTVLKLKAMQYCLKLWRCHNYNIFPAHRVCRFAPPPGIAFLGLLCYITHQRSDFVCTASIWTTRPHRFRSQRV